MAQSFMSCQWSKIFSLPQTQFQPRLVACGVHLFPFIALDEWFFGLLHLCVPIMYHAWPKRCDGGEDEHRLV